MASVALSVAGAIIGTVLLPGGGTIAGIALGSVIGGAVGGAVGAYIDSNYIFPAIFGNSGPTFTGPRIDDFQVQTASEGSLTKFVMGSETRIAGTLIYLSDLIEVPTTASSGGKGGGSAPASSSITYLYYVDVAIAWCEGSLNHKVRRIYADSKVIFSDGGGGFNGLFASLTGSLGLASTFAMVDRIVTITADPLLFNGDFRQFLIPGSKITIAGYAYVGANGTHDILTVEATSFTARRLTRPPLIKSGGPVTGGPVTINTAGTYTRTLGSFIADGFLVGQYASHSEPSQFFLNPNWMTPEQRKRRKILSVTALVLTVEVTTHAMFNSTQWREIVVSETLEEYSTAATFNPLPFTDARCRSITNYSGSDVQTADPVLTGRAQQLLGPDFAPAYRGTCYTVIERLALRDFGNRPPQLSALIETDVELTVGRAIGSLMERARVPVAYDTTEVRGTLRGYVVSETLSIAAQLEPLLMAFNLGVVEDEGTLVFYTRGTEKSIAIDPNKLASFEHGTGGNPPRLFSLTQPPTFDLPSEITVQYNDPSNGFLAGSQAERRINTTSVAVVNISLPLVMEGRKARDVAKRLLYSANVEAVQVTLTLPGTYSYVQEGDLLTFTAYGEFWTVRVDGIERGSNHLLQITGVLADTSTYRGRSTETTSNQTPLPLPYAPPPLTWHVLDVAALTATEVDGTAVVYWGVCATDVTREWRGGALLESFSGAAFGQIQFTTVETPIGVCDTTLGAGELDRWDLLNTLDVTVRQSTLSSRTDLEVLNGANRALVGSEIIGFVNATLLGANKYRLTRLLRGQRDTRPEVLTHGAAERFIQLDSASGLVVVPITTGQLNVPKLYKSVATGGVSEDEENAVTLAPTGRNLVQFAPCHLAFTGTQSTAIVVVWTRRSRAITRLFGTSFPLNHVNESYELRFYDVGNVLKRTQSVTPVSLTPTQTYSYSQADRITDFGTSPAFMRVTIGQIGPLGSGNLATLDMTIP